MLVIVPVYGGNAWGAAWCSVQPALLNGMVGLVIAPIICAAAAYFPACSIVRGSAIDTLLPERQETVSVRRAAGRRRMYCRL